MPAAAARRTVLQKVRGRASCGAPTACGRRVSGSLSLPSRGPFHLSFTVLCSTGHWAVFSLTGWSPLIPTGFLVPCGTLDPAALACVTPTGPSPPVAGLPRPFGYARLGPCAVRTPPCTHGGLGSSHSARRYSGNHFCFLFLRLLRCFSSPGSPPRPICPAADARALPVRVPPFRHLRITVHLPLPAAFRSLSRLSSAPSARASALRPIFAWPLPSARLAWHASGFLFLLSDVTPGPLRPARMPRGCFVSVFGFQGTAAALLCQRPWRLRDSNSRPPACKAGALPAELSPLLFPAAACFPMPSPA